MTNNAKGLLLGLCAFALFALHDSVVKVLGTSFSSFQVLFFSVTFGFPLFSLLLVHDAQPGTLRPNHPIWNGVRAVAIVVSQCSVFYAFSVLPLAETYTILFAVPLIITILAVPILGERVGLHRGAAVLVGLCGVLIVLQPGASDLALGHGAALLGAFSTALASIIVRRVGQGERQVVLLLYPMLAIFLVTAFALPIHYQPMALTDLGLAAVVATVGFIALNFLIAAYKTGEAAVVAPMQYSQILWASLYGFLIFDELPDLRTLLGAMVIIASGLYIIYRETGANISAFTPVLRAQIRTLGAMQSVIGALRRRDGG